jgi:hypothetical protein|tara:strand:+ start:1566 stop:1739 length:174 start_codon:yes stop_codon:yes gene_type:complete
MNPRTQAIFKSVFYKELDNEELRSLSLALLAASMERKSVEKTSSIVQDYMLDAEYFY